MMSTPRVLRIWLWSIPLTILSMVVLGGVTRLTGSGLSITDWAPIMGAIPPLSSDAWNATFAKYQATPQYLKLNHGMTLSEFQFIFFWEYLHRLVGRLIGVLILVPALIFWRRNALSRSLRRDLAVGFILGGLQGGLGWFMVKSGLVDLPRVSHLRLSAHLMLALAILTYFVMLALKHTGARTKPAAPYALAPFTALLGLQILYGAWVAGLRAGFGFNHFPKMAGEWFPVAGWQLEPAWRNWVENPALVQWTHRWLGISLAIWAALSLIRHRPRGLAAAFPVLILAQAGLGILTLVWVVPLGLAALHQAVAATLVAMLAALAYRRQGAPSAPRDFSIESHLPRRETHLHA